MELFQSGKIKIGKDQQIGTMKSRINGRNWKNEKRMNRIKKGMGMVLNKQYESIG
jgi:hypothetical protein